MNSSLSNMKVMDIRHIPVLHGIDKCVNSLVNEEITGYDAKLAFLQTAKELYETFRNTVIWVLDKQGRNEFYTHDYLEILDRMKNETVNEDLKHIIEKQKEGLNKKIDNMREKFCKMEDGMLEQLALNKKKLSSDFLEEIKQKIGKIRAEEKTIIDAYREILKLGKEELLGGISEENISENIRKFAQDNFTRSEYVPIDTAKDTIALLLLHYILRKLKNDTFYLIEEALYTRQIPLKSDK